MVSDKLLVLANMFADYDICKVEDISDNMLGISINGGKGYTGRDADTLEVNFTVNSSDGMLFTYKSLGRDMYIEGLKGLNNVLINWLNEVGLYESGGVLMIHKYKNAPEYPLGIYRLARVVIGGEAYEDSLKVSKNNCINRDDMVVMEKMVIGNVFINSLKNSDYYETDCGEVSIMNVWNDICVSLHLSKRYRALLARSQKVLTVSFRHFKGSNIMLPDKRLYEDIVAIGSLNRGLYQVLNSTSFKGIEGTLYLVKGHGARKFVIREVIFNSIL